MGPVAIRYARGAVDGEPLRKCPRIALGKGELLRSGTDVAILALGGLAYPALKASARLKEQGVDAAVANARFIKPLDRVLLRQLATDTRGVVTIEEAQLAGGFGSAVSEALEAMGLLQVPLLRIGLPDRFIEHGTRAQLLKLCELEAEDLASRIAAWFAALHTSAEGLRLFTPSAS
jgi:1-deoxy-D-xylulose-5-phosphate synthase